MKEATFGFILLVIIAVGIMFCSNQETEQTPLPQSEIIDWREGPVVGRLVGHEVHVIVIDSCEYLVISGGVRESLTHKGNCKFCEERRRNEINKYNH